MVGRHVGRSKALRHLYDVGDAAWRLGCQVDGLYPQAVDSWVNPTVDAVFQSLPSGHGRIDATVESGRQVVLLSDPIDEDSACGVRHGRDIL